MKSKTLHPDMYSGQEISQTLEVLSAENNKAYATLKTTSSRVLHAIECVWGATDESTTNSDPVFLMDMMELHEEVEKARSTQDEEKLNHCFQSLKQYAKSAEEQAAHAINRFDAGQYSDSVKRDLIQYYTRLKYFERLEMYLSGYDREL